MRHDHWIGGRPSAPTTGRYLAVVDPRTRQPHDEIAEGSAGDVDRAVTGAGAAAPAWADLGAGARAKVLDAIADAINRDVARLVELEQQSTGKTDAQARSEMATSSAYFRYYAGAARAVGGRTIDLGAGSHAFTRLVPYGVVGVIAPWNYPVNQACRAVAPALATGNAVVLKPSEFTSASAVHLASLATEAGLPPDVLNVVTGLGQPVGAALVEHPRVRKVAFTGSVETGRRIAHAAAERLIPLTLELGGKSPLVVFEGADLDDAVAAAVRAVVTNAGQVCAATTRVIVEETVHDELVDRVVDRLSTLQPGRDFGPIITEAQHRKVLDHIDRARRDGLEPVVGGEGYHDGDAARGWYIRPTVFARVDRSHALAREEIFGPVLVTLPFRDEAHALELANDSDYGLVAAVWTRDVAQGLRLAERIEAGQVSVNGGPLGIETPFGGFKLSGYGREKGLEALADYVQVKTVSVALGAI